MANAFGLIIAELVTNSFKHAYHGDERGPVDVVFAVGPANWTLCVADRGRGMPQDQDQHNGKGIGMKIITSLLVRLEAELTIDSTEGAAFTITGPVAIQ